MNLILLLILALFAAIAIKLVAFFIACLVVGFKIGIVAFVGLMLWKAFKAATKI